MAHKTHHHDAGRNRPDTKKNADSATKAADTNRQREKLATEQPSYESLDETPPTETTDRAEHRADIVRMGRRGISSSSMLRGSDPDLPNRGESRGINEASGGALSDEEQPEARGSDDGTPRGQARDTDELNYAGFSRGESVGRPGGSARAANLERSQTSPRGDSSGQDQEPTALGGFMEPDERTSGSSRRH